MNRFWKFASTPLILVSSLLVLFLFSACSHYHLGKMAEPSFRTIAISPILSDGFAPQVQAILRDQLIREFLSDGTLEILPMESADVVLEIVLTDFSQLMTASRSQDTALARSYEVSIKALCTLVDSRTQEIVWENEEVEAVLNLQVNSDFVDVQYQAIPALTRNLAEKIIQQVLNRFPLSL